MRARDTYELQRKPAFRRGQWWRRLGQLVALAVELGPVPGGGGRTLIVEKTTGKVIGALRQPFGNDFYDARIEEDLLILTVDEFKAKWLPPANS